MKLFYRTHLKKPENHEIHYLVPDLPPQVCKVLLLIEPIPNFTKVYLFLQSEFKSVILKPFSLAFVKKN